jgi:molybdopterin converting factor small subunit
MRIEVRYIGVLEEVAGVAKDEIFVESRDSLTLKELMKYILTLHPSLMIRTTEGEESVTQFTIAVNGRLVHDPNTSLKDGDIVLLMISLAGG